MGELREGVMEKTKSHPCYNECGQKYARMHIPVAPKCNIQCHYCNRKYDCLHESRPGVTSEILSPGEALAKYKIVKEKLEQLTVVGIAGPGDALANFEETKKSLELIRSYDPEVTFCLSTNGLMLPKYAEELVELGVSHITVTLNTLLPEMGAKIYRHVDYQGVRYTGIEGASILLENQLLGIQKVVELGLLVKINVVYIKGINDNHISEVVKKMKELGVFMTNIMPLIPAPGTVFENMPLVSNKELLAKRKECELDLKQMYHCRQCRADAIGILSQDVSLEFRGCGSAKEEVGAGNVEIKVHKPKVAVATKSGDVIDAHFGHVDSFQVYEVDENSITWMKKVQISQYCEGEESCEDSALKMERIKKALSSCEAVFCMRIGNVPKKLLQKEGIQVIEAYEKIDVALKEWRKEYYKLKQIS